MEAIALAAYLDEVAVVHEAIEEGRDGRCIAKELRPILQRSVGGDDRRRALITAHHDLQQILGCTAGELSHPKIVNNE